MFSAVQFRYSLLRTGVVKPAARVMSGIDVKSWRIILLAQLHRVGAACEVRTALWRIEKIRWRALNRLQPMLFSWLCSGHRTPQPDGIGMRRTMEYVIGASFFRDLSGVHYSHFVCKACNNTQVMSDENDGHPGSALKFLQ